MVEKKFTASIDKVYELLTDPKWLEKRCLDLGEISAAVKAKKTAKGATVSMQREVKREVSGMVGKVLPKQGSITIEETWSPDGEGHSGALVMELVGLPVKISGEITLTVEGKGCKYAIAHKAKCSVPLVGGAVEKFVMGELEKGAADELDYLAKALKK